MAFLHANAKFGVWALPLGVLAAAFGWPAAVGIPLVLVGVASGATLYFDKHQD